MFTSTVALVLALPVKPEITCLFTGPAIANLGSAPFVNIDCKTPFKSASVSARLFPVEASVAAALADPLAPPVPLLTLVETQASKDLVALAVEALPAFLAWFWHNAVSIFLLRALDIIASWCAISDLLPAGSLPS